MWLGTQISLKKNQRLMKVVLYFLQTSKGSRLFQNSARISRICESAWTLIFVVVDFHGCQFSVCKRASIFHSNQDLTGWQVVDLYWLNVNLLRLESTDVLTFNSGWINHIVGVQQPFLDQWVLHCFDEENKRLKAVTDFHFVTVSVACTESMMDSRIRFYSPLVSIE